MPDNSPEFTSPLHQQISDAVNGSIRRKLRDAAAGTALRTDMALALVDLLVAYIILRISTCVRENGTDIETELQAVSDDYIRGSVVVCAPGPRADQMTLQ